MSASRSHFVIALVVLLVAAGLGIVTGRQTGAPVDVATIPADQLIRSAVLARDVSPGNLPVVSSDTFRPDTASIYCAYELGEAARGRTFSYSWRAGQVAAAEASNQVIFEDSLAIPADASGETLGGVLTLELPGRAWPEGDYRLELRVDAREVMIIPFKVAAVAAPRQATKPAQATPQTRSPQSSASRPINIINPDVVALYDPRPVAVPPGKDMEQVAESILEAMDKVGWRSKKKAPGHVEGRFYLFSAKATIDIRYNAKSINIQYRDSKGLDYQKTGKTAVINELYNTWVRDLEKAITTNLSW